SSLNLLFTLNHIAVIASLVYFHFSNLAWTTYTEDFPSEYIILYFANHNIPKPNSYCVICTPQTFQRLEQNHGSMTLKT
ncbi:MAG TPA: hypothetical protein VI864_03305, partial [Candidatus Bathyarchaeia archaeon]|nr:hypothetical protein [Candidatus Bathyarchaeia archaeon]